MLLSIALGWVLLGFLVYTIIAAEHSLRGGGFEYDVWDFVIFAFTIALWPVAIWIVYHDFDQLAEI